jgi:hypothetical protein
MVTEEVCDPILDDEILEKSPGRESAMDFLVLKRRERELSHLSVDITWQVWHLESTALHSQLSCGGQQRRSSRDLGL